MGSIRGLWHNKTFRKVNNIEIVGIERLRSLIERVESIQANIKELQDGMKDVFAEMKNCGFDVKIVRQIIKLRKMDVIDKDEQDLLLETYRKALDI